MIAGVLQGAMNKTTSAKGTEEETAEEMGKRLFEGCEPRMTGVSLTALARSHRVREG